jgi:protein subunit release factor B
MAHISNDKWTELRARMKMLGILEDDIEERFILGSGSGGQKINKTQSVVQLKYKERLVRSKKSRNRDSNRFFARRELCNQISADLGIPTKDDMKIKRAIKQKKRRKSKSIKKYSDN